MATTTTTTPLKPPIKIAIIGSGAAGLAAARVVSRSSTGSTVIPQVFEKDKEECGGVWRYVENSKTTPMYRGLRTNLPKEVMQFRELPWLTTKSSSTTTITTSTKDGDEPSYITHGQVLQYLVDYKNEFDLNKYISYGSEVTQLTVLDINKDNNNNDNDNNNISNVSPKSETWPKIKLEWKDNNNDDNNVIIEKSDIFDAVFVCNGHYSKPSFCDIPGLKQGYFKGKIMHSIEYDDAKEFIGQTVLCIGGRASGSDLAREISQAGCNHVYLSDTTCEKHDTLDKVTVVPKTIGIRKDDGTIEFDNNCPLTPKVDTIIFCSGYDYSFPFINNNNNNKKSSSNLELDAIPGERRVKPLYQQLFHAKYPNICFIGLPHSVVPFPLFELQAEAAWAQWEKNDNSNEYFALPPESKRLEQAYVDAESGGPKQNNKKRVQDTHYLGNFQWDYCRTMSKLAGNYNKEMENYIATSKALYDDSGNSRKDLFPGGPDTYRSNCYTRDNESRSFERFVLKEKNTAPTQ